MTHSKLTTSIELTSDSSSRNGRKIDRFIVHHAATTSLQGILNLFKPGGRTVSANYALKDNALVCTVDEDRRAWTSSSASWDGRAVTIEVANSSAGGSWPVSAASFDMLAKLIADVATRYGFAINDSNVITHQELWTRYRASYATACPGDLQRRKAELLTLARKYQTGKTTSTPSTPKPTTKPATAKTGYKGIALGSNDAAASSNKVDRWVKAPGGEPNAPYWPEGKLMERIQKALKNRGRYNGTTDGKGAGETAKGIQRTLNHSELNGVRPFVKTVIDGKLGKNNAYGVQHYAAKHGDYIGALDGDPRANSWIGFALGLELP